MGESFWQKESFLQYTMTLLQGFKDPFLPTLIYITDMIGISLNMMKNFLILWRQGLKNN